VIADGDAMRVDEARVITVQIEIRGRAQAVFFPGTEPLDDLALARDDTREIDAHGARPHAPAGGVAGVVGDLRRGDHCLGRRAPGVDARPTHVPALDEGDLPALRRHVLRQRAAALAAADHDGVVASVLRAHPCASNSLYALYARGRTGCIPSVPSAPDPPLPAAARADFCDRGASW
jgi:hypothetical protein